MNASRTALQASLFGAALLLAAPAFAIGKTEARAGIVRGGTPAIAKQAPTVTPGSYVIDFEDLAVGDTVENQYAAWGVTFSANPYSGDTGPTGTWATNTSLDIVAVGGGDTGALGAPPLVSGNLLHGYSGWLDEDGDASFLLTFDTAITSISIDFAGVSTPSSTGFDIFSTSGDYITTVLATKTGQLTLNYTGSNIGAVGVTPGDFFDWVGVDNISFTVATPVPEPESYGLLALGLGVIGVVLRRRQR